jgi:hypothetical protein
VLVRGLEPPKGYSALALNPYCSPIPNLRARLPISPHKQIYNTVML